MLISNSPVSIWDSDINNKPPSPLKSSLRRIGAVKGLCMLQKDAMEEV